jgi:outer membrane receptor for ferric coprogen and ferric-rhodotorulic acid
MLTPDGSSTVHIYTQTIHTTTQLIWEECRLCPVFASYTLAFALQRRKKHGKTSARVAEERQLAMSIKAKWLYVFAWYVGTF